MNSFEQHFNGGVYNYGGLYDAQGGSAYNPPPPPVETYYILAQNGFALLAQNGDYLEQQEAP